MMAAIRVFLDFWHNVHRTSSLQASLHFLCVKPANKFQNLCLPNLLQTGFSIQKQRQNSRHKIAACSLTPEMFEALQLLKSAYRNGHVSAAEDATKRVVAALDALDE
jgi:hypothetical protein